MGGPLKGYQWTTGSSYEYLLGNYENPLAIDSFCLWVKPGSVFYDLGANIGFYAFLANRFISTGKIYSFEPSPISRKIFEQHLAINKKLMLHNNISILPFAISDREQEISFSNNEQRRDGNTYISGSTAYTEAKSIIIVKCFSIDELIEQGYEIPDIIKVDVEGAEFDVLKGAVNTLKKYKPDILLATHECHLPGVKDSCINFLMKLGYTLKYTGTHNMQVQGLADYIAIHPGKL